MICEELGSEYEIFRLVSLTTLPSLSQIMLGMGTPLARQVKVWLSPTVAVLFSFSPEMMLGRAA